MPIKFPNTLAKAIISTDWLRRKTDNNYQLITFAIANNRYHILVQDQHYMSFCGSPEELLQTKIRTQDINCLYTFFRNNGVTMRLDWHKDKDHKLIIIGLRQDIAQNTVLSAAMLDSVISSLEREIPINRPYVYNTKIPAVQSVMKNFPLTR